MAIGAVEFVCDVCGQPATQAARDMICDESAWRRTKEYRPHGPVKYGCDAHPVRSETHRYKTLLPPRGLR